MNSEKTWVYSVGSPESKSPSRDEPRVIGVGEVVAEVVDEVGSEAVVIVNCVVGKNV
jgi:hypothetical protein